MGSIQLCVDSSQTLPPFTSALKNGAVDGLAVDVDAAPAIDAALERPIRIGGIGDENGVDGDLHLIEVNLVDG